MPHQRRHHIDGQFADFKAEDWTCTSPNCNNTFYPGQTLKEFRNHSDLRCWSCGYKAFSEKDTDHELNQPQEEAVHDVDGDQKSLVEIYNGEEDSHAEDSCFKDGPLAMNSAEMQDQRTSKLVREEEFTKGELSATVDSGLDSDVAHPLFTKIKPIPLKSDQGFVKKKSAVVKLDINSNVNKMSTSEGKRTKKPEVSKPEDVKPFSTHIVCTCPHPCSSSWPSKGMCPLHPTTRGPLLNSSKSASASLKEPPRKVSSRKLKLQSLSQFSSVDSNSSFPGCTCPDFHDNSRENGSVCQVHPNLHHLRQPAVAADYRRERRIDNSVKPM